MSVSSSWSTFDETELAIEIYRTVPRALFVVSMRFSGPS